MRNDAADTGVIVNYKGAFWILPASRGFGHWAYRRPAHFAAKISDQAIPANPPCVAAGPDMTAGWASLRYDDKSGTMSVIHRRNIGTQHNRPWAKASDVGSQTCR